MIKSSDKNKLRQVKHVRMRYYINGTAEKPRLNVYKSNKGIYAQIIDDSANNGNGATLVAVNTLQKDVASQLEGLTKTEQSKLVGKIIGEKAIAAGIKTVVFDRGGYGYMGRVAAVADGAREAGLEF